MSWFNNDTGYKTRVPTCSLKMLQALRAESQYSMVLTCTDLASFAETQRDLNLSQQCGPARRVKEMTRIQVDYECGPADQSCTSAVDEKRLIWIQWVEFHKALSVVFLLGSNSAASACPSWLVNGILQHRNLLNNTDAMQCDAISAASLQAPCNLCPGLTMTPDTKPESLLLVA